MVELGITNQAARKGSKSRPSRPKRCPRHETDGRNGGRDMRPTVETAAARWRPTVVYRTVGLAAALAGTALVAQQLMTVLLAGLVTIILSLPLCAAASLAERHGAPRAVGAAGALIAAFAVLAGLGFAVIPSFISQVKQFAQRLPVILASADRYVHGLSGKKTHSLSAQLNGFVQGYLHHPDTARRASRAHRAHGARHPPDAAADHPGRLPDRAQPQLARKRVPAAGPGSTARCGRRCDGPCSDRVARLDDCGGARHAGARWLVVHRAWRSSGSNSRSALRCSPRS